MFECEFYGNANIGYQRHILQDLIGYFPHIFMKHGFQARGSGEAAGAALSRMTASRASRAAILRSERAVSLNAMGSSANCTVPCRPCSERKLQTWATRPWVPQ